MSFLFGSEKSTTSVPDWVKKPIMDNVARATGVANMGYTPYYGPDVAAFTPMQNAAFDGTNQAAAAFGMPTATGNGMPAPQTFAGSIQGYSSAPMYEAALAALRVKDPARYNALMQMNTMPRQQAPQQTSRIPGDNNGDGVVNAADYIAMFLSQSNRGRTQEERDADNARQPSGGGGISFGRGGVTIGREGSLFGGNSWG